MYLVTFPCWYKRKTRTVLCWCSVYNSGDPNGMGYFIPVGFWCLSEQRRSLPPSNTDRQNMATSVSAGEPIWAVLCGGGRMILLFVFAQQCQARLSCTFQLFSSIFTGRDCCSTAPITGWNLTYPGRCVQQQEKCVFSPDSSHSCQSCVDLESYRFFSS